MRNLDEIYKNLKKLNIPSQEDLFKLLNIKTKEEEKLLMAWFEYQRFLGYEKGTKEGREELKNELYNLIMPSDKIDFIHQKQQL